MSRLQAWIESRLSPADHAVSVVDTTPDLPAGADLPDDPVGALLALTTVRDWRLTDNDRLVLKESSLVWLRIDPEEKERWVRGWSEDLPPVPAQAQLWSLYYILARARVVNADRALALSVLGLARQREVLDGSDS